jgi:hypothetical protein
MPFVPPDTPGGPLQIMIEGVCANGNLPAATKGIAILGCHVPTDLIVKGEVDNAPTYDGCDIVINGDVTATAMLIDDITSKTLYLFYSGQDCLMVQFGDPAPPDGTHYPC